MTYTVETSLESFPAWSGGKDTLDVLIEKGLCNTVEAILNDIYVDGAPTDTEINDTLWFSRDEIAEWCGFSDWEELENGKQEEESKEPKDCEDFDEFCDQFGSCFDCPFYVTHQISGEDCEQIFANETEA